jgi:hypothetical protein
MCVCCNRVQALQQWHGLQQQWCHAAPLSTRQQLEAAEAAAWLLQRLATQQAVQQLLLDDDIEQLQQDSEASIATARQQLDDLAAAVKAAAPDAFSVATPQGEWLVLCGRMHIWLLTCLCLSCMLPYARQHDHAHTCL